MKEIMDGDIRYIDIYSLDDISIRGVDMPIEMGYFAWNKEIWL
jgi:hypothetical protein